MYLFMEVFPDVRDRVQLRKIYVKRWIIYGTNLYYNRFRN